jgi:high-affinity nickel permease
MPDTSNRPELALEAARDVVKQLVTIDAGLLTFGIAFMQNISKLGGPTICIEISTISLLVSLFFGVTSLFSIVQQTHTETGNINDHWLRLMLVLSMLSFIVAAAFISIYVIRAPIPLPS